MKTNQGRWDQEAELLQQGEGLVVGLAQLQLQGEGLVDLTKVIEKQKIQKECV